MLDVELHRLVIHFPIALTLVAVIYDSWAVYSKASHLHETGYGLLMWATLGALASVVSGLELASALRIPKGAVTGHAGYGIAATIVITALGILRYSARARDQKGYKTVWLVLEWAGAALIVAVTFTGHRL